jgi:3-hydroxybutyryl-CoA dehydrogenase
MIVSKDRVGFIVNYLLVPYLLDAIRLLEQEFASKEDIDVGMMLGTGYPMGPFTLLDFIGLDTALHIMEVLFEAFKEPPFAAPTLLRQMVAAGWLGRKEWAWLLRLRGGGATTALTERQVCVANMERERRKNK